MLPTVKSVNWIQSKRAHFNLTETLMSGRGNLLETKWWRHFYSFMNHLTHWKVGGLAPHLFIMTGSQNKRLDLNCGLWFIWFYHKGVVEQPNTTLTQSLYYEVRLTHLGSLSIPWFDLTKHKGYYVAEHKLHKWTPSWDFQSWPEKGVEFAALDQCKCGETLQSSQLHHGGKKELII